MYLLPVIQNQYSVEILRTNLVLCYIDCIVLLSDFGYKKIASINLVIFFLFESFHFSFALFPPFHFFSFVFSCTRCNLKLAQLPLQSTFNQFFFRFFLSSVILIIKYVFVSISFVLLESNNTERTRKNCIGNILHPLCYPLIFWRQEMSGQTYQGAYVLSYIILRIYLL